MQLLRFLVYSIMPTKIELAEDRPWDRVLTEKSFHNLSVAYLPHGVFIPGLTFMIDTFPDD